MCLQLSPERELLAHGQLTRIISEEGPKKCNFLLCNDVLIVATSQLIGGLILNYIIDLRTVAILDVPNIKK